MHDRTGSRLVLVLAVLLAVPRLARAQVTDSADCPSSPPGCSVTRTNCCTTNPAGSAGGILIPLDRCHQRVVATQYAPVTSSASPNWCINPTATNNNAMFEAFGLAYRMMQWSALNPTQQIPFYWVVNPTKAPSTNSAYSDTWTTEDVDLWVLSSGANPPAPAGSLTALSGTSPIQRLKDNGSGVLITDSSWASSGSYTMNEFPVRGSAFYIPPQYRANFNAFWAYRFSVPSRTGCGNGLNCWDFTDVAIYQVDASAHFAWQDFTQALSGGSYVKNDNQIPVAMVVNYPPPKIAAVMSGTDMTNWLAAANINDFATNSSCASGTAFSPTDAIECQLQTTDVDSGNLVSGGFTWAWFESTATSCTEAPKINAFLTGAVGTYTAGNAFFFNESISNVAEGCGANNMLGTSAGILAGGNVNETSPAGNPTGNPIIVRWPANLFAQYGDMPLNFAAGTVPSLVAKAATGATSVIDLYNSLFLTSTSTTLRRLMTWESACGSTGGFKGPSCTANPVCTNHDDLGHTSATSPAGCDSFSLNTASKVSGNWTPDDDVDDIYVYGRYQNNVNNGIVFYAPGQNITQNGQAAQLRMVLSALIATPPLTTQLAPQLKEITRSSPVPFLVGGNAAIVQGSYEYNYVSYTIGGTTTTYQVPRTFPGIYTHDDVGVFTFPGQAGHFRAIKDSGITTTAQAFNSTAEASSVIFDTAKVLPSMSFSYTSSGAYDGGSRTIFTANSDGTSSVPATTILFNESNASATIKDSSGANTTLGNLLLATGTVTNSTGATLAADQKTLIDRVIAGDNSSGTYKPKLGGVDRSTAAVIGPSSIVSGLRPTVAYFGATDGMLHAVCADNSVGVCAGKIGTELWAFIPRTNLSNLRYNNARIDGSPRVVDLSGKFSTCPTIGVACWRTILVFQTGSGDATSTVNAQPAMYALDISNPTSPKVLWEYATPAGTNRHTYELGVGLVTAMGTTTISTTSYNLAIAETNNGGTGGNGVVVTAIDVVAGTPVWQFAYPYPALRSGGDTALPSTGIPGGATIVDKTDKGGNASFDTITFGDLYGDLWELKSDGSSYASGSGTFYLNQTGALGATPASATGKPLFSFSEDYHPIGAPPAIYNNGNIMFAVFAEGGYADVSGNSGWGNNLASGKNHYALAISLNSPTSDATFDENQNRPDILFKIPLGAGEKSYAEVTIVGTQVFITTDTSQVNAASYGTSATPTGNMYAFNIGSISNPNSGNPVVAVTGTQIQSGAGSIANNGTTLYASNGSTNQQIGTGALTTVGPTVTAVITNNVKRQLWLRLE